MNLLGKFAFLGGKSERRKQRRREKIKLPSSYKPIRVKAKRISNALSSFIRKTDLQQDGCIEDSEWVGNRLDRPPPPHVTRIMLLNCKGLPRNDLDFFNSFLLSCIDKHVHYCGLTEINLNAHNFNLKKKLSTSFEQTIPGGIIHFNNSKIHKSGVEYQPGGVSAWCRGKMIRKYMSVGFDPLGRWMFHQFQGAKRNLRIYTLYRVNPSSVKEGSGSAWEQQRLLLSEQKIFTNPRKQVIIDLCEEIQSATSNGFEIILMSDLNEGLHDGEKTNQKLSDIGLTNILASSCATPPRTYNRG